MRLLMGLKLCAEKRYRKELDRQLRKRIPVGQHFIQVCSLLQTHFHSINFFQLLTSLF
jgi:hypothetical protein